MTVNTKVDLVLKTSISPMCEPRSEFREILHLTSCFERYSSLQNFIKVYN